MDTVLDTKVNWPGVGNFSTVQGILDRNKVLINEINSNHEDSSSEALDRNFYLIQELNSNLTKIMELYKELSSSFVSMMEEEPANPSRG
mmetsp:Transcript_9507/g.27190  ORF Transcript_9507/g.27190 Transcript_9507/m.27190 type:complete len:89 (+) Transcript_9507:186-452(+)